MRFIRAERLRAAVTRGGIEFCRAGRRLIWKEAAMEFHDRDRAVRRGEKFRPELMDRGEKTCSRGSHFQLVRDAFLDAADAERTYSRINREIDIANTSISAPDALRPHPPSVYFS